MKTRLLTIALLLASCADDQPIQWQNPAMQSKVNWTQAIQYCEYLHHAGKDDWRLPTVEELLTLSVGCPAAHDSDVCSVGDTCLVSDCAQNECYCAKDAGPTNGCYWPRWVKEPCSFDDYWASSQPIADDTEWIWAMNYAVSAVGALPASYPGFSVRCIR